MSLDPLVRLEGVRMAFDGVEVLKGINLELCAGEVHGITGENGAGKSTLAKIIAGVHQPTSGTVRIGTRPRPRTPAEALDAGVALIHQEPMVFPHLSVAENIYAGRHPRTRFGLIDWRSARRRASDLLGSLGSGLRPDDRVEGLSIASQQMVELAAALSQDARVLILDETTASLTPAETERLFGIVRILREQGCAIAFVSHRLAEVFEICDRVAVLRDGEKVGEVVPRASSIDEVVRLMIGRSVAERIPRGAPSTDCELLVATGLSKKGSFDDVSLSVHEGEIVALAGLVGSGRSEVVRAIFGLDRFDAGSVRIEGNPARIRSPRQAMRLGIGLVPEDRQREGLFLPLGVAENATIGVLRLLQRLWVSPAAQRGAAEPYLGQLRVVLRDLGQSVQELSGGNQQKVVLAKWLLTKPKLLIVDEPTRGIDIGAKEEVHRLLRQLADGGMGILMVSSDLTEVLELSDRILVVREGRMAAEFRAEDATAEDVMLAATGQGAHAG